MTKESISINNGGGGNHGGNGTIQTMTPSTGETKESSSSPSSLSSANKLYTCDVTGTNENLKLSHLTNGVEYTFKIRAMNGVELWSPWSNSVGPIILVPVVPNTVSQKTKKKVKRDLSSCFC